MNGLLFSQLKCIAVTRENDIFIRWLENDTFVRWLCTDLTDIRVQYKNLEKLSKQTIIYTIKTYLLKIALFNWFVSQPVSTVFFSYQISISHQPANNQQYFSLITNQHQVQATTSRIEQYGISRNLLKYSGAIGLHEGTLMIFGLVNAGVTYQHIMSCKFISKTKRICKRW